MKRALLTTVGLIILLVFWFLLWLLAESVLAHGDGCIDPDGYRVTHFDTSVPKWGIQDDKYKHGHEMLHPTNRHLNILHWYQEAYTSTDVYKDCRPAQSQPTSESIAEPQTQDISAQAGNVRNYGCDTFRLALDEICHEWDLNETHRVGVPALPDGVKTIADLWENIYCVTGKRVKIQTLVDGLWQTYEGEPNETGETEITPHIGLVVWHAPPFVLGISGVPMLGGEIELTIPNGKDVAAHAIGFPEPPAAYEKLSDLVVDGVDWVRRRIRIDGRLRYLYIRNASDAGDKVIESGDSVTIRIRKNIIFDFRGSIPAAPMAGRSHTLATSWGAMKYR